MKEKQKLTVPNWCWLEKKMHDSAEQVPAGIKKTDSSAEPLPVGRKNIHDNAEQKSAGGTKKTHTDTAEPVLAGIKTNLKPAPALAQALVL